MLSEKQHIDDFFRRKEEAFTPDDQAIDAHWQQMRTQLTDPEPTPGSAKAGSNISRHFNKFLGGLITVIIIAVLAINPFHSHKKSISKTKQATTAVTVKTVEAAKKSGPSDSLAITTIIADRLRVEQVPIATSDDYGVGPMEDLPMTLPDNEKPDAYALLQAFYKKLEKPEQEFYINADHDTTLIAKEGTRLFVPANILLTNAAPVKGPVKIVIREYYRNEDIIAARLHTTSKGQQLITGGMLHISAEQDGKPVIIAPQKSITVEMPTNNYDSAMQLFAGKETPSDIESSSTFDWLPVELSAGAFPQSINVHGPRTKEFNLNRVEPYSVSYGKKTIAKFYVAPGLKVSNTEIISRLKERFGSYYDVIKLKRARRKAYDLSATGKPLVIDSALVPVNISSTPGKPIKQNNNPNYDFRNTDSFYLEQQERLSATYSFALANFGWYNCDKFSNGRKPKVSCKVILPEAATPGNHVSLLVFTRHRSVIQGYDYGGHQIQYNNIPEGEPVLLITVAVTADKVVSNIHAFTTSNTVISNLVFEPTTPAQFKQKLESLFASQQQ